jgi:hypothetical protein
MAGDFDDVNSPDFQEALNNAGRATASSAKTYEVINKLKGLYNRTGALAQLMLENPDMFNRLKQEYPSAFDYASAEGAAQYAEYTYEKIRKAHPGQTPEDKIERIREVRALADNDNVDSQHAELVQVLANARGDRDTVDRKKVEKTIKLYDQWIRDAKSNPVVYRNYQQPAQRSAYIRGELDKLKKDRELYAAVVSSITHGDIKASDELKSIVKEHSGAGRPQQAKLKDKSQTELAVLAQNGKVKVKVYVVDGTRKWSYHALTPEEKAKGDKYWIEHNKQQRPELFGLTREQVNAGNDNKPAESRSAGGNSGNAGSAESRGNLTISDNMKYALNMGPTVLKEELEAMGYKFDASMIRHGANGDYIPTSKLRAWIEKQEFTAEQISRLNALVDDRAAFNAKVKEINERDSYVAPAPQAEAAHEHTAAAPKAEAAQEHAAAPAAKEKPEAEQEQSAPEGNTRESGAVEEDPKVKEDKEKARELLKKDPKKFETARAAYEAAGDQYHLGIMNEVAEEAKASKEALKSKAKGDKKKADQATQEVKEEHQKKSLKKALKNRANDVSNFFKKTFGIKTKKDKEKEATAAVEQQKAEEMQKAVASRKITLEHDKDGNAVYTLSGYGRFDGGDHNGLYDGKYTVYQFGNASAVKFAANDGTQFTDYAPGGQQLSLIQTLKDEMAARSSEQAQVAARAAAQQKTNS